MMRQGLIASLNFKRVFFVSKQVFFKWVKRTTLVLGIIPVLLFLAFAGAVNFIDFNQYKSQIEQEVTQYTGREFKIGGTIEVSVFPFEFTVTELALRNPEGFDSENLLAIKTVEVELSFWSLLRNKEMDVIRLELFEPQLHLIKTETGDNWSDIKGLAMWLKHRNVNTHLNTAQTASEWLDSLERVQVALKPDTDTSVETLAQADSTDSAEWAFESLMVQNGTIQIYDKTDGFAETLLNINVLAFDLSKDTPFDMSSDFLYQNSLSPRLYDVHLNGTLEVKNQFTLWQLTQWNGVFKVRLPEEKKVPEIRLTTRGDRFEFDVVMSQITVENGELSGLDAQLQSSFSGQFGFNTLLSGTVTLKHLNFKSWAKHLGVPLPTFVNKQALSEGNGQFEWYWDGSQLLLNDINVEVDKSTLQGDVSYDFERNGVLRFELRLNRFNVDFYQASLPNVDGKQALLSLSKQGAPDLEAQNKTYLPIPLSIDALKGVTAFGQLTFSALTISGVKLDTLEIEVLAENGMLELAPFDATLYQGELLSQLQIDLTGATPSVQWKGRINHLSLEGLAARQAQPVLLAGSLVSRFDMKTSGANLEAIKANLNGRLSLEVTNAKLAGIDMNNVFAGELDLNASDASTELQKITLVGRWQDGLYSARKLDVISERFSASGVGTFDLKRANIDTTLNIFVKPSVGGEKYLVGRNFPVTYRGILQASNASERARWHVDIATLISG